jgi:diguanylate cyclase (GGDEF)-like protein
MNSVRNRILLFFSLFAISSCVIVYMGMRSTETIAEAANSVVNNHLSMVFSLGQLEVALQKQDSAVYRYMTSGEKEWLDASEEARSEYNKWFVEAQNSATDPYEEDKLSTIDELYVQYDNLIRQVLLSPQRSSKATLGLVAKSDDFLRGIQSNIEQIQTLRQGMTIVHQKDISDTVSRHKRFAFSFLGIIIILFVVLALYLWHYLVRPLTFLLEGIRDFTRGKTDIVIPPVGKDELGELQEAFNEMSREITVERKRLNAESQSDALTGLFNMRYFRRQLVEEFSRSQRYGRALTILMLDVDHFKAYNDKNGHPAGDIVLKEISRILIRNVRGTDIVARYGGEEFVMLLPETGVEAALIVAEKIRRTVQEHHFPFSDGTSERMGVSIGVASYPEVGVGSDQDLIEASDKALYLAKRNGRNQVCIYFKGDTLPSKEFQQAAAGSPPAKG